MRRSHDRFAAANRGHLNIENSLRWCLDVAFREDHSRVHDCFAVDDDLAWLKRFAIKHPEASERQGKHRHETPNSWLELQLPDASNWHHGTLVRVCPAWKSKAQATHDKVVSASPDSSINRACFILTCLLVNCR
jgi:hypothetical protein